MVCLSADTRQRARPARHCSPGRPTSRSFSFILTYNVLLVVCLRLDNWITADKLPILLTLCRSYGLLQTGHRTAKGSNSYCLSLTQVTECGKGRPETWRSSVHHAGPPSPHPPPSHTHTHTHTHTHMSVTRPSDSLPPALTWRPDAVTPTKTLRRSKQAPSVPCFLPPSLSLCPGLLVGCCTSQQQAKRISDTNLIRHAATLRQMLQIKLD